MSKTISATALRSQLSSLLDQLKSGETHFIIERNNEAEAVLLNINKFHEIMQMLEVINRLEFIGAESGESHEENNLLDPDEADLAATDPFFGYDPSQEDYEQLDRATRSSRTTRSESIEMAAARLGIRVIK